MVDACSALLHLNIYLYSKGDKGEKLIYFYGCSDFKLHFRSLTHWVAFDRTSFDGTFFTVHCWRSLLKSCLGKIKFYFLPLTWMCPLTCGGRTFVRAAIWSKDVGLNVTFPPSKVMDPRHCFVFIPRSASFAVVRRQRQLYGSTKTI